MPSAGFFNSIYLQYLQNLQFYKVYANNKYNKVTKNKNMETLHAPLPKEQNAPLGEQHDPWPDAPFVPPEHDQNLAPLPNMSPDRETQNFNKIADELVKTGIVSYSDASGRVTPAEQPSIPSLSSETPRSHPLASERSTDSPVSSREALNRKATLTMAKNLEKSNPALAQEIYAAFDIPTPSSAVSVTENVPAVPVIAPETPTTSQPEQHAVSEQVRPENYEGRHRLTTHRKRGLGRIASWFAGLRS